MRSLAGLALATIVSITAAYVNVADGATISEAVENPNRTEDNRERDGARKPADMLAFIGLGAGNVVLDYGSGGGYWSELFSGIVGSEGKVHAHQNAGERFESNKDALTAQLRPFGNIELLPLASGTAFPLADDSVDTVMLSYIYHHLHFSEDSDESFPAKSAALVAEFARVLKPGGTFIVIEHVSVDGSSRAQSAAWHRTPPETAKADITGVGFEFADEAAGLYMNPDDDLMNVWYETGLSGKTTTFVHKYQMPQ